MSLQLKTTGLATLLLSCVGVDDDGTTVKDFVVGNTAVHDANIAAPKTAAATWKGTSRGHFKTDIGAGGTEAPRCVTWAAGPTLPMGTAGTGVGFFAAVNSLAAAAQVVWMSGSDFSHALTCDGASNMRVHVYRHLPA